MAYIETVSTSESVESEDSILERQVALAEKNERINRPTNTPALQKQTSIPLSRAQINMLKQT
jgi:hypothetical protein